MKDSSVKRVLMMLQTIKLMNILMVDDCGPTGLMAWRKKGSGESEGAKEKEGGERRF